MKHLLLEQRKLLPSSSHLSLSSLIFLLLSFSNFLLFFSSTYLAAELVSAFFEQLEYSVAYEPALLISAAFSMSAFMANVAECLDTEDFMNLRLNSRFLRDGSEHKFAERYFHERRHIVTPESLECLLAISRHARFGRAIRTIAISDMVVGSHIGTEKTLADKDFIHRTGLATLYLTEVFKNATSCEAVIVNSRDDFYHWGKIALVRETGDNYPFTWKCLSAWKYDSPLWLL